MIYYNLVTRISIFVSSYSGISYDFQQCKLAFEENKFLPIFLLVRANTNLLNDTFLAVVDEKNVFILKYYNLYIKKERLFLCLFRKK